MINIIASLGGVGERRKDDFYPTPWEATVALLEEVKFPFIVQEPACGDGAISEVLRAYGHNVISTDIRDHGYADMLACFDFLALERGAGVKHAIITNPPFNQAKAFILKALSFTPIVAMLLKADYPNALDRLDLFEKHPPSHVLPLTWRLDFTGAGSPHTNCTWFVWGTEPKPMTLLRKPGPEMNPVFR